MRAERGVTATSRPAMGAEARIATDASPVAVAAAHTVIATLEARWSRFLPHSELSRANDAGGPSVVRPSTARVIETALAGRTLTDGWYDPTRGRDLVAAGYAGAGEPWGAATTAPDRPAAEIVLDAECGLVDIPAGVAIDLGGVAKGWAADAASGLLFDGRTDTACVEVGGDLRVRSRHQVAVEVVSPTDLGAPALVGLRDGGVAVSSPVRRRSDDGRHHLIDPFTGAPAAHPRVTVVIAASAAGAEMLATACAVAPLAAAVSIIERTGATGWLIESDGDLTTAGTPDAFLLDEGWLAHRGRRAWTT